ncbi:MAG: efflux RND transporter permease subunit [Acidobacteriia bacterium]|nr:efflux RND transporter permease subunit [Terriglobia bacterium]MYG01530.1 efflux RND transporter permease subunit [Terriglobia bacterium]MYK09214.1 efflux RND transporter permease subunit [Terriglobia bacterium]
MKGLIGWFARNGVAANLILLVIVASGAIVLADLKQEIFPEFSLDMITVEVRYRGAGPEEVEDAICLRVEEALQGIDGIKKMTSAANEGAGLFTLEIPVGYDVRRVLDDVKAAVDAIDTFPEDVEKPVVREVTSRFQVINVAIAGEAELTTLKRIGEQVRDGLTALPEVSQASLLNAPPYEISIEVSDEALRRWGLTLDRVADAVRQFSVDLPGGSVKTDNGEILFRTKGQAYSGEEYEGLPLLTRPDGTRIYLRDVATVIDGFEDLAVASRFNGKPAVMVKVFRVGDQNAISVSKAVQEYVERASASAPNGIEILTWHNSARYLESRVDLLVDNALTGLLLVFVVLALFLRLRLAFWITLGIPISFLGAIALMPHLGISINMISLFSFILVLGIVVDDAIVVGENIHTKQLETGEGPSAAIQGTYEVLVPVTFGVLTTMAAFAPMLFVPGVMGKLMAVFPLIILPTLFFSLVESNLILPSHLAHYKRPASTLRPSRAARLWNGFFDLFSDGLSWVVRHGYRPLLRVALDWRYVTISLALFAVLLTVGLMGAGVVRTVLFPVTESDNVVAFLTMPRDVPVQSTRAGVAWLEQTAVEVRKQIIAEQGSDPVLHMLSSVGEHPYRAIQSGPTGSIASAQGDYLGEVDLELLPSEERTVSAERIANLWRERVGQIPGAVEVSIEHDLVAGRKAIDLQLSGADLDEVREVAETVKSSLAKYAGVFDVSDTYRAGKPEIELALTAEGEALGLTLQGLGKQVRQGFFGEEAQRVQRDRDDLRVMVRYPLGERRSVGDLERIRVRTPQGDEVPFSTVATGSYGRGPASITRIDRQRSINVQAEIDGTVTSAAQVIDALEGQVLPDLIARHPGVSYAFEGDEAEFAESIEGLAKGFGVIIFVIYGMLAIPLKSYWKPVIILSAIPFGMVGAIWGHAILGMEVSFLSMCGMVALAGVVINDALVMVAYINKSAGGEASLKKAVRRAGEVRFRAILLTSLTTAAGVTPLILEESLQAQFLIPMAVALAAGVLFATAVTLVLVPALYLAMHDIRSAARWIVHGTWNPT